MDENRANILNESNRVISKLQLLSVYFGEEMIYKIYLRTQVIHQLFEHNEDLDVNKLDLFHLQFTSTLIALLKKIKKSNENNLALIYDEIQVNKELIEKLTTSVRSEGDFNIDKQRQALKINTSLRKLYQVLSDDSGEYPFSKNINSFSSRYAEDFFYDIPQVLMEELLHYNDIETYHNAYAVIHRKLLGQLCKYEFMTSFFCGLKTGTQVVEIYKFNSEERYFLFSSSRNLFLFCDVAKLAGVDQTSALSKKQKIIQEMMDKNDRLQSNAQAMKTHLPQQVKDLLAENYKKISDIDFLQNMSSFDVQANMLKAMLNTDGLNF